MSYELYYTSAPKGLQPASQGFCTVACSKGIPAPLIEKLEALSGYRPLYPPHDAKADLNPVSFGHAQVRIAGKTYQVLSRVCFAGLDYTDRTNKFAHHVALEPHELPIGGPAWLLRQPGFMEVKWDGQVRHLPAGRVPPQGDSPLAVCREWQRLTGDAGWAGAVADSFLMNPDRPAYFLFEPGMDLLAAFAEAIALLPAEHRWDVAFNTYLAGLSPSVNCPWRGLPRSAEEAAQARRIPGAQVIAFGEKLPAPPPSPLVESARSGKAPAPSLPPTPTATAAPPPRPAALSAAPAVLTPAKAAPPALAAERRRSGFALGMLSGILASALGVAAMVLTGFALVPAAGFGQPEAVRSTHQGDDPAATDHPAQIRELRQQVERLEGQINKLSKEKASLLEDKTRAIGDLDRNANENRGKLSKLQSQLDKAQDELKDALSKHAGEIKSNKDDIKALEQERGQLHKWMEFSEEKVVRSIGELRLAEGERIIKLSMKTLKNLEGKHTLTSPGWGYRLSVNYLDDEKPKDENKKGKTEEGKKKVRRLEIVADGKPIGSMLDDIVRLASVEVVENDQLKLKWDIVDKRKTSFLQVQKDLKVVLPNQLLEVTTNITEAERPYLVSLRERSQEKVEKNSLSIKDLEDLANARITLDEPKTTADLRTHLWEPVLAKGAITLRPLSGARLFMTIDDRLVEIHRQP